MSIERKPLELGDRTLSIPMHAGERLPCRCEHERHFDSSPATGHVYGQVCNDVSAVTIPDMGEWQLCPRCTIECFKLPQAALQEAKIHSACDFCKRDVRSESYPEAQRNQIVDGKTVHGPQIVDGKIVYGPWAWMCYPCYALRGAGLGLGLGQRWNVLTGEKLEG